MEETHDFDPDEYLLLALAHFRLTVTAHQGKSVSVDGGYVIEVEGENLYKLTHAGTVVGPFADVEKLCRFIQADIQLNG